MYLKGDILKLVFLSLLCFVVGTSSDTDCSCFGKIKANVPSDKCKCYLTDYCMKKFWTDPHFTPTQDDVMGVAFLPYMQNVGQGYPPQPAFNITFTINNEKIKGLTVHLQKGCYQNASKCRYFDFNSYKSSNKAIFYTDEFFFQSSWGKSCTIEVKGLNDQLIPIHYMKFLTKIPESDGFVQDCASLSEWQSLVTLDRTSYDGESMKIAFTTPPEMCNVTSFKLLLIENNKTKSSVILEDKAYAPVFYKRIHGICPDASYTVQVAIYDKSNAICGGNCYLSSSSLFSQKATGFSAAFIVVIVASLLTFTLIAGFVLLKFQRRKLMDEVLIYIAYSYDIEEHQNVVQCLAAYLREYCHCKVLEGSDMGSEDPLLWVSDTISAADYVLIIWSRGAKLKMNKNNTKVLRNDPGHLGNDLFSTAMTCITSKINNELRTPQYWRNLRKFVNISFSYVPTDVIPCQYDYLPFYRLPSGFNALLCHLHGIGQTPFSYLPLLKPLVSCNQCYPKIPCSDLNEKVKGIQLLKSIKEMDALEKKGDWLSQKQVEFTMVSAVVNIPSDSDDDSIIGKSDSISIDSASANSEQSENEGDGASVHQNVRDLSIYGHSSCESLNQNLSPEFSPAFERRASNDVTDDHLIDHDHQIGFPLDMLLGPDIPLK